MTICAGLAGTVWDFTGWSQLAIWNYDGHPGNAGVWDIVWPGVGVAWCTLQVGRQVPLPTQQAVPLPTYESAWRSGEGSVLDVPDECPRCPGSHYNQPT